ncbi:polysaccharide biosynthesis/export family protein [Pedobacter gandavensis]|uniref:polysaccharide biosynthesis/export family protein n=1 Tax=Pedobacter gandavensis TaxID=2679963 RepID=UPI00292FCCC0|nr:polysaccharide biosynthesis/export family protein [Pedobacter gandavensis]
MVKVLLSRKYLNYLAIFSIILLNSCSTTKKVPYFQDITANGGSEVQNTAAFKGLTIDPDDILSILLVTVDPTTGMPVNQLASQQANSNAIAAVATAGSSTSASNGFLVDKNGEIDLSIIGKVKVAGLTTYEARDLLKTKAAVFYKDPNVQVRYANFKVTVLGEVAKPSSYILPNEKVSVLDALGMAGDLTIFGKRENVLLIRDHDGKKEFARLDLNSSRIFDSPFYYLKQNDVIYVEPNKGKAASLNQARTQTFAVIGTALSVLIVLFSRL